jgi:hypothetical protein
VKITSTSALMHPCHPGRASGQQVRIGRLMRRNRKFLFDHLVSASKDRGRDDKSLGLGGLKVELRLLRNPTTGITVCCAPAGRRRSKNGHELASSHLLILLIASSGLTLPGYQLSHPPVNDCCIAFSTPSPGLLRVNFRPSQRVPTSW